MEQLTLKENAGVLEAPPAAKENALVSPNLSTTLRAGTKRWNVLRTLLERQSLDCFEAVRHCHDYVLRSTVSDLQSQFGIRIDRELVQVPNCFGGETTCARYWISDDQRARAMALLGEASQ